MSDQTAISADVVNRAFQAWLGHHNAREVPERSPKRAMRAALEAVWPEPVLTREDADVLLAALGGSSYWHLAEAETVEKLETARRRVEAIRNA